MELPDFKTAFGMSGLDVIAGKLMTGKPLKILEPKRFIPKGVQSISPVKLYSQLEVDPVSDDLAGSW